MNEHKGDAIATHKFNFSLNNPEDVKWREDINQQMRLKPGFPDYVFYPTLGHQQMSREKLDWNQKTFATGTMNIPWPTVRPLPKRPDIQNADAASGYKPVTSKMRPKADREANHKQVNKTKQLHQ